MDGCFITAVKTISITFGGGRRGTRTPSPFKERIYSPRGYQLPVTLPNKVENSEDFHQRKIPPKRILYVGYVD